MTALLALAAALSLSAAERNAIEIKEWSVPWADSRPRDPDFVRPDAVWFVGQTGPVPSGAGAIRNVDYDPRAGRIWFGTDANTIGYAEVD